MIKTQLFKRYAPLVLTIAAIFIAAFFSSLPLLIPSESLQRMMSQAVQEQTGSTPTFKEVRVSFLPTPVLHLTHFSLEPAGPDSNIPSIKADKATFRPVLFSLLMGKPSLAHVVLSNATIQYVWREPGSDFAKTVSFEHVSFDLWNFRSNKPIRFRVKAKFLSDSDNVNLSGTFTIDFKNFRPKDLIAKAQVSIDALELSKLASWWRSPLPIDFKKGTFSSSTQIIKRAGISQLDVKGSAVLKDLIYEMSPKSAPSVEGDYQVKYQAQIDLESGALILNEGTTFATPFGPFEAEGRFNVFKTSVEEVLVKSNALHLETFPQYILPFEKIIPVNLGLSGESQLDFFVKGQPELLVVNSRIDLTKASLAYSKYFSKSSGVPLFLKSDMKLVIGRGLRGDFSADFEQASLKGSLVGLDLATGQGEMTILTNKFSIKGWEQYFPLLRQFELSGAVKILTSVKGNFNRFKEARVMNNISLDHLEARSKTGARIYDVNGSIDFGPLDSELKGVRFGVGHSQFSLDGKMFWEPNRKGLVILRSEQLKVLDLVSELRKIDEALQLSGKKVDWRSVEAAVTGVFSPDESLDDFESHIAFSENHLMIPDLYFNVFGGRVSGQAMFDFKSAPSSVITFELDRLSFARMYATQGQPVIEGNLFATAQLKSDGPFDAGWLDRLKGTGSLAVANGEFHSFDLLGGLGKIAELAPLGSFKSGKTRFSDVRGDFEIESKKIKTGNLLLVSDDFQVEAAGDIGFDGNLNFRLSLYLAPALGQSVNSNLPQNARLGPIPILLTGPISNPSIHQDPMLIQTFLESLVRDQFSKITSRWFAPSSVATQENAKNQVPQKSTTAQPASLEQALLDSGFNLLEQFLSQKKSSS
ncbi:MAG: hypothetical protein A3C35_00185 [Omnitrophica bacterium RIFCSPHIGHO2_02_FULL_46_11]|nr:MAG: hypothetical protein A3C35_00185 [Omnitrophica bacterium RIFCSPHIGHO2_02_FULL_46_11]